MSILMKCLILGTEEHVPVDRSPVICIFAFCLDALVISIVVGIEFAEIDVAF